MSYTVIALFWHASFATVSSFHVHRNMTSSELRKRSEGNSLDPSTYLSQLVKDDPSAFHRVDDAQNRNGNSKLRARSGGDGVGVVSHVLPLGARRRPCVSAAAIPPAPAESRFRNTHAK